MVDRPSLFTDWDLNETDVTAPSGSEESDGYAQNDLPTRQVLNRLFSLWGQWTRWFSQTTRSTADLHPNHALPGGTAPSIGAGLGPISAGEFSAHVFADGYDVGPGDSSSKLVVGPATPYTYTASRDTYWDLSRAGVWTPVVIPVGDPETGAGAVTANSTRVYRVRTDATDRTALVDRRRSRVRLLTFDALENIRQALLATLDSPGSSSDADRRIAKRTLMVDSTSGATYELVDEYFGNNAIDPIRVYLRMTGGQLALVMVVGARCTSTSGAVAWIAESTTAYRWVRNGTSEEFAQISGLTADVTTFNDSEWTNQTGASDTRLRRVLSHGQRISIDPTATGSAANLVADLEHVRRDSRYTLIDKEVLQAGTDAGQREYFTNQLFGTVGNTQRVFARNCYWDDNAAGWARDSGGVDSYILTFGNSGAALYVHLTTEGATWSDAIALNDWTAIFGFAAGSSAFVNPLTSNRYVQITEQAPATMPASPRLYADTMIRAWGLVATNGAGGFATEQGVGYTASIVGGDLRITFDQPFASSTSFACTATSASPGDIASVSGVTSSSADIDLRTDGGVNVNLGTAARSIFFIVVGRI